MRTNLIALAWRNVRSRKARSWLTIVGIMIGVMAVITLISVGTGVENAVLRQFRDVGLDIVLLTPTTGLSQPMRESGDGDGELGGVQPLGAMDDGEAETIGEPQRGLAGSRGDRDLDMARLRRDVPEIHDIGQVTTRVLPVLAGTLGGYVRVLSPSEEMMERFPSLLGGCALMVGRVPGAGATDEVLLGSAIAQDMGAQVGDPIRVGGVPFTVVGILAPARIAHDVLGGDLLSGESAEIFRALRSVDDAVVVPHDAASLAWPDPAAAYLVSMRIRTGISVTDTILRINTALVQQGALMTPISTQALADNVQRTLGMVRTVLASIAAISLVVGAVGMMNTMYTAVLERTREIGILKSVGAKDRQVLGIFLVDSGLMGVVGGVLGIVIGVGVSLAGTTMFGRLLGVTSFVPAFAPWLIVGTLVASFALGAAAGVWPAWHASRMDPVRALRSS